MTERREKRALITGITGQDGSYLAELLLGKGYEVHGVIRRASSFNTGRIDHLYSDLHESPALRLHYGDLSDGRVIRHVLEQYEPQEVYNLGAQSHVRVSFDQPEYTADVVGVGMLRVLEAVREYSARSSAPVKVYQAGSSEMYGAASPPQNEETPFHPRSPYAVSKVAAHWFARNYREAYGLFITNGILFNHESPRRGETFVTRKITRAVGRIREGLQQTLYLGNLDARRDWGFAGDYVEAMWLMLQHDEPDDFVVAPGSRIRCANSSRRRSAAPAWTGGSMSRSTRAISGRARSTICRATRPRRAEARMDAEGLVHRTGAHDGGSGLWSGASRAHTRRHGVPGGDSRRGGAIGPLDRVYLRRITASRRWRISSWARNMPYMVFTERG